MTGPLSLLVKPASGLCNMRCAYCFYRDADAARGGGIMTRETVDVLVKKAAGIAPAAVSVVFQGGEPTLAGLDFFRYFTQRMRALRVPVRYAIQTNGLLLDDAFAGFLKENRFLVGVSLDGAPETNASRRDAAGAGVSERVLRSIRTLDAHGVGYNVLSVVDDRSAADIARTWRYFKAHGFRFLQFIPCLEANGGSALSADAYARFLKESFDLWYADFTRGTYISVRHIDNYIGILMGRPPENCAMTGVCGSYFVVEANGDLYPCDFYCDRQHLLGNIYDDAPFRLTEKRRAFIEDSRIIRGACRACEYRALCRGGCRRDRTDGLTKNRYCAAYRAFFDYAGPRMAEIAAEST